MHSSSDYEQSKKGVVFLTQIWVKYDVFLIEIFNPMVDFVHI